MLKGLRCRDSLFGVVLQHLGDKVNCILVDVSGEAMARFGFLIFSEISFQVFGLCPFAGKNFNCFFIPFHLRNFGPGFIRGNSKPFHNARQLLEIGPSHEQRLSSKHLCDEAADGPDIDGLGIPRILK